MVLMLYSTHCLKHRYEMLVSLIQCVLRIPLKGTNKMKKIIAMLLAMVMMLSLVACGGGKDAGGNLHLSLCKQIELCQIASHIVKQPRTIATVSNLLTIYTVYTHHERKPDIIKLFHYLSSHIRTAAETAAFRDSILSLIGILSLNLQLSITSSDSP